MYQMAVANYTARKSGQSDRYPQRVYRRGQCIPALLRHARFCRGPFGDGAL